MRPSSRRVRPSTRESLRHRRRHFSLCKLRHYLDFFSLSFGGQRGCSWLQEGIMTEGRTDFYTVKYTSFGSDVATELRREVFGEDIGQQGWRTAAEQAEIAEFLGIGKASHVLYVCCGSGVCDLKSHGSLRPES